MRLKELNPFEMDREDKLIDTRKITCECGLLTRSDGSCCLYQGNTTIMASVNGPTEVRTSKECMDQAYIEVTFKPKVGLPGCVEKNLEKFVSSTCRSVILTSMHPRSSFGIVLQEMENGGSLLACCINATCLALLNAAVPLNYLMAAVTTVITEDGQLVLDPTEEQERAASANMTFVFSSKNFALLACYSFGRYSDEQFQECLLMCAEASKEIFQFYRSTMEKQLNGSRSSS